MEIIKFDRVISVNSEIQNHEAKLLLAGEVCLTKSWLCAKGTDRGVVILKLERAAILTKVDIGNDSSAFIEILVGRATDNSDQFQTLVPTSTFMTPNESKASLNSNQVRFFTTKDFDSGAVGKPWDLLKLVCTQPFNKNVPFGICFIKLHGEATGGGGLHLKIAEEPAIAVGSFFRRKKEEVDEGAKPLTLSEQIREAEKPGALAKHTPISVGRVSAKIAEKQSTSSSSKDKQRRNEEEPLADNRHNKDLGLEEEPSPKRSRKEEKRSEEGKTERDKEKKEKEEKDKEYQRRKKEREEKLRKLAQERSTDKDEERRRRMEKEREAKLSEKGREERRKAETTSKPKRKRKPFHRLLEDVVFVLSGYQNPERASYRSHALAMGAKYSQDWQDGKCTHLVAAYFNTPKCNQVRGKGKIVSKDWIEKCFNDKKRYPWRRFALDKTEKRQPESEEEIDADSSPSTASTSRHSSSRQLTPPPKDDGSDSEKQSDIRCYDAPTDDEDEGANIPTLPDYFRGKTFYVDDSIADRSILERYIIAYNGVICDKLNEDVNYYITLQRGPILDVVRKTSKNLQTVSPTWIQSVNCSQKFIPAVNFLVD